MAEKRTKQQKIDEEAIDAHKAIGADNPGGQNRISPQRFIPKVQDDANAMPKRRSIMGPLSDKYQTMKGE